MSAGPADCGSLGHHHRPCKAACRAFRFGTYLPVLDRRDSLEVDMRRVGGSA
jgi:hypothetical protein